MSGRRPLSSGGRGRGGTRGGVAQGAGRGLEAGGQRRRSHRPEGLFGAPWRQGRQGRGVGARTLLRRRIDTNRSIHPAAAHTAKAAFSCSHFITRFSFSNRLLMCFLDCRLSVVKIFVFGVSELISIINTILLDILIYIKGHLADVESDLK